MEQVVNPVWPDSYRKVEATDFCQRLGAFSNALTQHPHVAFDKAFCMALGIGKYGNGAPMIVKSSLPEEILNGKVNMLEYTAVLLTIMEL